MDFVHDDCPYRLEHGAALVGREEDEERLRRGDQDMRWTSQHLLPLRHWRIPGAHHDPQLGHQQPGREGRLSDFIERLLQIFGRRC